MAIPRGEVNQDSLIGLDPSVIAAMGGVAGPKSGTGAAFAPPAAASPSADQLAQPFITIPGQTFSPDDYNTFIQGDPGYMGLKNSLTGNEDAFHAALRGAVQKSIISSGYAVPEASQFLDPGQADQAAQNPYSTAALATQAHSTNLRQIQNALAARGGYDSGELTYGVGNESQRFNQEDLSNRGQMADYIAGLLGQESTMKGNDAAQLAAELGNATSRQFALHPGSGSTTANFDTSTGTYIDSYGNHFDPTGKLLSTAPAPSGGSPQPTATPNISPIAFGTYGSPGAYGSQPGGGFAGAPQANPVFSLPTGYETSNAGQSGNLTKLLGLPV